jgi:hypothetical protein
MTIWVSRDGSVTVDGEVIGSIFGRKRGAICLDCSAALNCQRPRWHCGECYCCTADSAKR